MSVRTRSHESGLQGVRSSSRDVSLSCLPPRTRDPSSRMSIPSYQSNPATSVGVRGWLLQSHRPGACVPMRTSSGLPCFAVRRPPFCHSCMWPPSEGQNTVTTSSHGRVQAPPRLAQRRRNRAPPPFHGLIPGHRSGPVHPKPHRGPQPTRARDPCLSIWHAAPPGVSTVSTSRSGLISRCATCGEGRTIPNKSIALGRTCSVADQVGNSDVVAPSDEDAWLLCLTAAYQRSPSPSNHHAQQCPRKADGSPKPTSTPKAGMLGAATGWNRAR
jgi:hypothetical protein